MTRFELFDKVNEVVNPVEYDDANAGDIGAQINTVLDDFGFNEVKIDVPPGQYTLSTPVDYAEVAGRTHVLDLEGARIDLETSGQPGFDFTGAGRHNTIINGGRIHGTSSSTPSSGILLARSSANGAACAFLRMNGTLLDGEYTKACVTSIASEGNAYFGCDFNNDASQGHTFAGVRDNSYISETSPYSTIMSGDNPNSTCDFYRCGFRSFTGDGDGLIALDGVQNWAWHGGYVADNDQGEEVFYVPMKYEMGQITLRSVQQENNGHFWVVENNTGSDLTWQRLKHLDGSMSIQTGDKYIHQAGTNSVLMQNPVLKGAVEGSADLEATRIRAADPIHVKTFVPVVTDFIKNRVTGNDLRNATITGTQSDNVILDTSHGHLKIDNQAYVDGGLVHLGTGGAKVKVNSGEVVAEDDSGSQYTLTDPANGGSYTASGDGTQQVFTINHGLGQNPNRVSVTPKSEDAMADYYVTENSTDIGIHYDGAPPSGTDNLEWWWEAEV